MPSPLFTDTALIPTHIYVTLNSINLVPSGGMLSSVISVLFHTGSRFLFLFLLHLQKREDTLTHTHTHTWTHTHEPTTISLKRKALKTLCMGVHTCMLISVARLDVFPSLGHVDWHFGKSAYSGCCRHQLCTHKALGVEFCVSLHLSFSLSIPSPVISV